MSAYSYKESELQRAHNSIARRVGTFTAIYVEGGNTFTLLLMYSDFLYKFSNEYVFFQYIVVGYGD